MQVPPTTKKAPYQMIDTIQQIKTAQEVLARPLPDEMKFRPGYEMAQNTAKRDLEKLLVKLGEDVSNVAVTVYVDGPTAPELCEAMLKETDGCAVDLNELYGPLVAQVKASIGRSKEFGVNQFALIIREVRQLAVQNNLAAINIPTFKEPFVFQDDGQLEQTVVDYANKAVGVELAVNYIRKQAATEAAKLTEKTPVFPVFIKNCRIDRDALAKKVFKRGLEVTVVSPVEIDKDSAINALKSIKKSLKQTKE